MKCFQTPRNGSGSVGPVCSSSGCSPELPVRLFVAFGPAEPAAFLSAPEPNLRSDPYLLFCRNRYRWMYQQLVLGWVTSFQHHRAGQHQPNPAKILRYFQGWTGPRCVGPVPEGVRPGPGPQRAPRCSPNMWMCPLVIGLKLPQDSRITCVLLVSVMALRSDPIRSGPGPVRFCLSERGEADGESAAGRWRKRRQALKRQAQRCGGRSGMEEPVALNPSCSRHDRRRKAHPPHHHWSMMKTSRLLKVKTMLNKHRITVFSLLYIINIIIVIPHPAFYVICLVQLN